MPATLPQFRLASLRLWLFGLILFAGSQAASAIQCTAGGVSYFGTELFATRDYKDGHYDYQINNLQCSGSTVISWLSSELIYATPSAATQQNQNLNLSRVFTNTCGSHVTLIHNNFYGTVNGVSLTTTAYPKNATYPDVFGVSLLGAGPPLACPCAAGQVRTPAGTCVASAEVKTIGPLSCPKQKQGQPTTPHPIILGSGDKTWQQAIYTAAGPGDLAYGLSYTTRKSSDQYKPASAHGANWQSNYDARLVMEADGTATSGPSAVYPRRPSGRLLAFRLTGGVYVPEADVSDKLLRLTNAGGGTTGWRLTDAETQFTETYDAAGKLLSLSNRQGQVQTLAYDASGRLATVTDAFGRQLALGYDASNRVSTLTQPDGGIVGFAYDANNNLTGITWPDTATRQFHYEHATHKNSLTGITDENAVRYATYGYDSSGRATSETLAGGADAASLGFSAGGTTVTDALGSARVYSFTTVLGVPRSTGASQPAGAGCAAAASAQSFDGNGNVASRTDFNNRQTTFTYDLTRNLETSRTEAAGTPQARTISTAWHANWRLPTEIAEPFKRTRYTYNGDSGIYCAPTSALIGGLPIPVVCQRREQGTGDANGSQGLGAPLTGPQRAWSWTYNAAGLVLTEDGPRTDLSDLTTYSHYADTTASHRAGYLATITDALGHVTQITAYDANGRPLTVIDPNGVTLAYTWTARGQLATSSIAGQTTTYRHDPAGLLTGLTRPDGSIVTYTYDAAHRLTAISDSAGNSVNTTLDAAGNITETTWRNPDGSPAQRRGAAYDALGRLQSAIDTRNAIQYATTYGYDPNGNRTSVTDPKQQTTSTQYDALNRPTQITDALVGLVTLAYDARDALTGLTAANGAHTGYTVDALGNLTGETSADRGSRSATYDAAGNRLTVTDARGITATTTWDALNRPLTVSYPSPADNLAYTWDAAAGCANGIGRLCRIVDAGGGTTFSYDVRGNVVSETRSEAGGSFTTQYAYDAADRLATLVAPTGKVLTALRDGDGRIQEVATAVDSNPQVKLVANVKLDAAGHTTAQTFGDGSSETRSYAADGLPAASVVQAGAGGGGGSAGESGDVPTLPEWGLILLGALLFGKIARNGRAGPATFAALVAAALLLPILAIPPAQADETLTYDANGNIATRTLQGGSTTYGYDALDRVASEAGPAKTQSLTYDANGNRLTDGAGSKTYAASSDRLATENGQAVTLDAAGNVTAARGYVHAWNQAGQLKSVAQGSTLLASYTYDYRGRRTRKETTAAAPQGAGTILYHYDRSDRLIAETTAQGNPLVTYAWRDDVPVALIVHGVPEKALYFETDHLNTPIAARNAQGQVVWRWESDAFGSTMPNEDPGSTGTATTINLRFPGQYYDKESGLHYNHHRYYDPKLGRYLSSDPIGLAGGLNTYSYVGGNPVSYVDPKGLQAAQGVQGVLFCIRFPQVCANAARTAAAAAGAACAAAADKIKDWFFNDGGSGDGNTNPYTGPVDQPVVVVDQNGNAIPVGQGEQVSTSPNGDYQQVIGADGKPTGDRLDRGGHKGQKDPRAQGPHGHRPGVTTPDGNPHLPIR